MFQFVLSKNDVTSKKNNVITEKGTNKEKSVQQFLAQQKVSRSPWGGMLSKESVAQLKTQGINIPPAVDFPGNKTSNENNLSSEMPESVQTKMENSLGSDFGSVNIHQNDSNAAKLNADAYALGNDICFAPGKYNPNTTEGQELLGHELSHVVQQKSGLQHSKTDSGLTNNHRNSLENEADSAGKMAAKGQKATVTGKGSGIQLSGGNGIFGEPPQYSANIGLSIGSGGLKVFFTLSVDKTIGDFTGSYGFGATYHTNFLNTGISGLELRNSLMLNYTIPNTQSGISLGTNMWNGLGAMSEFTQRTGIAKINIQDLVGISYENDGEPFQRILLGDGNDSYRTAAASLQVGDFSLNTNLFTGRRDTDSFKREEQLEGGKEGIPQGEGEFGEVYTHGFVEEEEPRYRYGGLTLNFNGLSAGIDSDRYIRHPLQNLLAHDFIKDQRQFEVLSDDINMVLNQSASMGFSKFTTWGY